MYPSEQQTQQTSIANRSAEVIQSSLLLKRDGKAVSKGNGFLSIKTGLGRETEAITANPTALP